MKLKNLKLMNGVGKANDRFFIYDGDGKYICDCSNLEIAREIIKRIAVYEILSEHIDLKNENYIDVVEKLS